MKVRLPGILGVLLLALASYGALELISMPQAAAFRKSLSEAWTGWLSFRHPSFAEAPGAKPELAKPALSSAPPRKALGQEELRSGEVCQNEEACRLREEIKRLDAERSGASGQLYKRLSIDIAGTEERLCALNMGECERLILSASSEIGSISAGQAPGGRPRQEELWRYIRHLDAGYALQKKRLDDASYSKRWFGSVIDR